MVKIRLARVGKKKQPTYRFVVSDSQKDLYGKSLEILGSYNPFSKVCDVKKDRVLFWLEKGAQCSPTAHNLLVDQNIITGKKVKASKAGKKKAEPEATAKPAETPATETVADAGAETPAAAEEPKTEKPAA